MVDFRIHGQWARIHLFSVLVMQQFLQKIGLFFGGILLIVGGNTLLNYYFIQQTPIPLKSSRLLFMGDSHIRLGINPTLLPSAQNIAQQAEPYVLTFWKLKKLYSTVRPDTLLLGFGPQNITSYNDDKFGTHSFAPEMFRRSYTFENFKSLQSIDVDYKGYYRIFFQQMVLYPHRAHFDYIGSYLKIKTSNLRQVDKVLERHFFDEGKVQGISITAIAHLDSILQFCQQKKIVPILINMPVYPTYYEGIPVAIKERYELEKNRLIKQGIRIIDGAQITYPDHFYGDVDHLNGKGAKRFTKNLAKILSKY